MNASVSLPTLEPRASALPQGAANLLQLGGALWIAHYALQVVMGLSTGGVSMTGPLGWLDGACFSGAIVALCGGLGTFVWSLRGRAPILSFLSSGFALVAASSMIWGFVNTVTTGHPPGLWGGLGVIGSCLSATFTALAAKRACTLSPRMARFLLIIGLLTFPLIILFALPEGRWVPAFWTAELPFALSGAAYVAFARAFSQR